MSQKKKQFRFAEAMKSTTERLNSQEKVSSNLSLDEFIKKNTSKWDHTILYHLFLS